MVEASFPKDQGLFGRKIWPLCVVMARRSGQAGVLSTLAPLPCPGPWAEAVGAGRPLPEAPRGVYTDRAGGRPRLALA